MTTPPVPLQAADVLTTPGFTVFDEQAYRVLLRDAPLDVADVPALLDLSEDEAAEVLVRLSAVGLVDVRDGTVVAAAPGAALHRVIGDETRRLERARDQLETLRRLIPTLEAEYRAAQEPRRVDERLRTIPAGEVLVTLRSLAASTGGDLLWLRPDQWRFADGPLADRWVEDLLSEGRRSRVIYPARVLEEAPDIVRRRADHGEHVRVLADLPGRLAVIGDSAAMLPRRFDQPDDLVLVIEQPALVQALTMFFESLWDMALVVPGIGDQIDTKASSAQRLLLDQLTRGAKDEQIARTLGLSLRTVRRRIAEVMDELGAASRFQAGVEAVRRGWL
ncbi:helix-turn-helix transcriptional regulator [Nocardioides mesophilus]|uniref:Helix-turn-helix transcriptional regulator n=1 Tax=Nocardioides mesophilus TaxID=433659 RepID=A0A7G9RF15_9ACTN|nr:helix-turn-helix transcriptional regulator [Nocardioides mesophilus]QNN54190.1 helix-turn-helix transcriptional regulator [Nocardioides mesophilus]